MGRSYSYESFLPNPARDKERGARGQAADQRSLQAAAQGAYSGETPLEEAK